MTLKDFDPGWHDRVKFRAKFKRYHPSLPQQLFDRGWFKRSTTALGSIIWGRVLARKK